MGEDAHPGGVELPREANDLLVGAGDQAQQGSLSRQLTADRLAKASSRSRNQHHPVPGIL